MALNDDKIAEISKIGKNDKVIPNAIEEAEALDRQAPNKERFDNLMGADQMQTQKVSAVPEGIEPVEKATLMDEVRNINARVDDLSKVNNRQLIAQANDVIKQIESVKEQLKTPNLDIKNSTQTILHNKLVHIDENLRVALSKAGVEYQPSTSLENKRINPIDRFLGFLTDGQKQLGTMSAELEFMSKNDTQISPANMLRMQMKMGYITQEIEFFTAVLNKSLESTKTIMNIQV